MANPLVTVAIPSYNHAKYISQTIQSTLDQTLQDFEILIVDDASTDNSIEVIKSFNDPRIRLIQSEKNRGVCETSNICIANSKGTYIALIASDDVMKETKLEKQIEFLEKNPNYGAVFSGIDIINENGDLNEKKTRKYTKIFEKENRNRFQWLDYFFHKGNCLAATSLAARSSSLKRSGGLDFKITQAHDFNLWIKLCLQGNEIHIIREKLLQYRERDHNRNLGSNTKNTRKRLVFDNEKVLRNFLQISSITDFIKIFPETNINNLQNILPEEEKLVIGYLIFQEAYKNKHSPYHLSFAINLMYELLTQEGAKEILEKIFGFTAQEYNKIITLNPLGSSLEENKISFIKKSVKKCKKIFAK